MEIEELLRRASTAPLGPLALTYVSSGNEAWTLTVTLSGKKVPIRARQDTATGGLILTCTVDDAASLPAGAWVTDTIVEEVNGRSERRLWLHGDGLSSALLLSAVAALAQVATSDEPAVVQPTIVIPPPPEEPDPIPLERPKPVGWNSFGFVRRATEPAEQEPAIEAPPGPEVETATEAEQPPEPESKSPATPEVEAVATLGPAASEVEATPQTQSEPAAETIPPVGTSGYCRECGSPYLPEHAFCTNCGARLN